MNYLNLALAAMLGAFAVSCAAGPGAPAQRAAAPFGLPGLADLQRSSAAADEFLLRQDGADLAGDLLHHRVTVNGTAADFTPDWTAESQSLSDAALAIYRLTYDPADAPITLALDWAAEPLLNTDCWIGLANWTTGSWQLITLPVGSELPLANPTDYLNASQHCYVAVILLGQTQSTLNTIGFGVPEPPVSGDGYTLIAPLGDRNTYLIDMNGTVVHSWMANLNPGATAKLEPNGHLLRAGNVMNSKFTAIGGAGGRLTEFDWDNNVVWYYDLSTDTQCMHHDFCRLPNGNVLAIVWDARTDAEVTAVGREPGTFGSGKFWSDRIIEIEPTLPSGGNIVWEWDVFDHLIQNYDQGQGGYGDPIDHPELVDINYPPNVSDDWTHINGVAYNAEFDQIIVTVPYFGEVWVIDHSTTTLEAAGHEGGLYGKGGDLLYRWGNPFVYQGGTPADQQLFFPHNAHWIADGLSGAGNILIFNNQAGRLPGPLYTTVLQITPDQNPDGSYNPPAPAWGPQFTEWRYMADPPESFYNPFMSSAQRLPGGNTLICSAATGWLFEVDAGGTIKWEYHNEHPTPNGSIFAVLRYPYDHPAVAELLP